MNIRTTLVLLVLVIVCTGLLLAWQKGWLGKGEPDGQTLEEKRLFEPLPSASKVSLQTSGGKKVVLSKVDQKWRLVEPVDAPALGWQADSLATDLTNLKYLRASDPSDKDFPGDDLTRLSAPRFTASVTDRDGKTVTIKVGEEVPPPPAGHTYVQVEGDPRVYVVAQDLREKLDKSVDDFREKVVARFDSAKAERIVLTGELTASLVKTDGDWTIERPVSARANQSKVRELLSDLSNLSAEKFVSDAPTDYAPFGLERPRQAVSVELAAEKPAEGETQPATTPAKGETIAVVFGAVADSKDKTLFARRTDRPWVFTVKENVLTDLQPKLLDLRDRNVLDIGNKDVTGLEIADAKQTVSLKRQEGHWRMVAPLAGPADDDAVESLVSALRGLEAADFKDETVAPAAYGFGDRKITLSFRGSDKVLSLLIGRKTESGLMGMVKRADSTSAAVVKADVFDKLSVAPAELWSRTIGELPADATVTEVRLQRPDGTFRIVRSDGAWRLAAPVEAPADDENVRAAVSELRNVRADKIVSLEKALPADIAKAKPIVASMTISQPAPEPTTAPAAAQPTTTTAPATATAPAPEPIVSTTDAVAAIKRNGKTLVWKVPAPKSAGPVAVGELGERLYDALAAEMRNRTVVEKIDADKVAEVTIVNGPATLAFKRVGGEWTYPADTAVKIDAKKITDLLGELSELKAERFADYAAKADLARYKLDKPERSLRAVGEDKKVVELRVSSAGPEGDLARYAAGSGAPGVFVLGAGDAGKLDKKLTDFVGE